ncbi:MAG TPA: alpha-glucan family phosphorylase [Myxococcota bacterium]|nr:alpha-glucan family phosphorylase [Myxococcota bacterium]
MEKERVGNIDPREADRDSRKGKGRMLGEQLPAAGKGDIERAIADLVERLPPPISPLARIAYNYRWTWTEGGGDVFRDMDPPLWQRSGFNPRWLIEALPPHRLQQLAADPSFVQRVAHIASELDADARRSPLPGEVTPDRPVAYFCSEFGGHSSLPLYGGGLGVLAGDVVKAASDLGLPFVAMSLFYRQGYFHQRLDTQGWQIEYWKATEIERLPAALVTNGQHRPLTIPICVRGRTVKIQIWRIEFGRVPLFLLDTDRPDNHPIDRFITGRLYVGDRHTRLAQYAILGCGGVRALRALGIEPSLIHLNEGHAALSVFERLGGLLAGGATLEQALARVRETTVFTTHTPVAAGNEWYTRDEVEPVLGDLVRELRLPDPVFYDLGRFHPGNEQEPVNLTPLALRMSRTSIGVSERHGAVSRSMWRGLWPEREVADVPIGYVTNGVHTVTWMAPAMQAVMDQFLPADWRTRTSDLAMWDAIARIPDAELWQVRCELRERLVRTARERSVTDRLARGEAPSYVEAALHVFDPTVLTVGFARRVATYKRLHLLTRQLDRALRLLADMERPIQVLIAGKAHPADREAKETLRALFELRHAPNVASRTVFLEDYDLELAPCLVAGVDLWLNLPRPPQEASGTSGMKVTVNGGLNLSVMDGWWSEAYDGESGWAIASGAADPERQDDIDSTALFNLLSNEIVPLFYERNADGLPVRWLTRIKTAMRRLIPRFSADRMLRGYVHTLYEMK